MLSHEEKEKLLRDFHKEPAWALGVVLKSVVCLSIIFGLAWIGSRTELRQDAVLASTGSPAAANLAQHRERASVENARKVFEERRARVEGRSTKAQIDAAP